MDIYVCTQTQSDRASPFLASLSLSIKNEAAKDYYQVYDPAKLLLLLVNW